jgi:hypothetical protein
MKGWDAKTPQKDLGRVVLPVYRSRRTAEVSLITSLTIHRVFHGAGVGYVVGTLKEYVRKKDMWQQLRTFRNTTNGMMRLPGVQDQDNFNQPLLSGRTRVLTQRTNIIKAMIHLLQRAWRVESATACDGRTREGWITNHISHLRPCLGM